MDIKQKVKNIICAVDFSEESMKAVEFAAALVGMNSDVTLYLLNVVKPVYAPVGDSAGAAEILMEQNDAIVRESREKIEEIAKTLRNNGLEKVHGIVRSGEPVSSILNTLKEFNGDLIVMGNRKHGFRRGILLGSVSERVSADSPVSVLIVR
ncbi:MAG: universal stress protein [Thermoplasmataceae archaeon]